MRRPRAYSRARCRPVAIRCARSERAWRGRHARHARGRPSAATHTRSERSGARRWPGTPGRGSGRPCPRTAHTPSWKRAVAPRDAPGAAGGSPREQARVARPVGVELRTSCCRSRTCRRAGWASCAYQARGGLAHALCRPRVPLKAISWPRLKDTRSGRSVGYCSRSGHPFV